MKKNNTNVYFITIPEDNINQRIDNFLHIYFKGIPKSLIYRMVRKGEIRVNKKKVKPKYKLQMNDKVRIPPTLKLDKKIYFSPRLKKIAKLNDIVLYEDDYVLILNKPSGTAVHGGSGLNFGIIEGLRALRPHAHSLELVHRLDRDTSGVLLISKKHSTLRILHELFRAKKIKKDYIALVRGQWPSHTQVITTPLLKNVMRSGERLVRINSHGKSSETHFKIEEQFTFATLVKARPITGRTHQIRVHAQSIGHPIAFDHRYGDNIFDKKLKKFRLNRLFLHASTLRFDHPVHGKTLQIEAPLDPILHQCLLSLRDHHKNINILSSIKME